MKKDASMLSMANISSEFLSKQNSLKISVPRKVQIPIYDAVLCKIRVKLFCKWFRIFNLD